MMNREDGLPVGEELRALLEEMRPRLGRILASWRIPPIDADDLLQDVSIQFLHKRKSIVRPHQWFTGALRNECRMYWRTHSRRRVTAVDDSLLDTFQSGDRGVPEQERRVLRRNLKAWISELDYRCREILRLRYGLGYESKEVADEMGYKPSSIDKVTRRCLDVLGRKLAAALPPGRGRK